MTISLLRVDDRHVPTTGSVGDETLRGLDVTVGVTTTRTGG